MFPSAGQNSASMAKVIPSSTTTAAIPTCYACLSARAEAGSPGCACGCTHANCFIPGCPGSSVYDCESSSPSNKLDRIFDHALTSFARIVLLLDPMIGIGESFFERCARLPAKYLFDEGVVTVAAGHASGRTKVIIAVKLYATDPLGKPDQIVDRD